MTALPQALKGLKVIEVGGYAAGPWIGKVLANFGATVIHIEATERPDGFRLQYPPYKDGKKGINRSGCFSYFNDSKYAITMDVKKPGGLALARKLSDWSDVLVENMRPGVIDRIGLGYEDVKKTNSDLIFMSTCNMGQTGPRAATGGFGSQLSALAGFCGLTGDADGSPQLLYGPYIDFVAALVGTPLLLAALDRRRRTGEGAHIDVSQYECGAFFLGGALLDYHKNGTVIEREANNDAIAVPHNAYPCTDDGWIAASCWDDDEFKRLSQVVGQPGWTTDKRFADADGRRANVSDLDQGIGAWTAGKSADVCVDALQNAGVHAYKINSCADLFTDPQLAHRKNWRVRKHPEIDTQAHYFPGFDLSEQPGDVTAPAPLLGQDNEIVFKEFLGLSDDEYNELEENGVF
ncbi:MAG: CoA transferase [Rhodospirillales bacterium]|jgi:crotonobetainyl-CoA:carnitine CoA-transferase CaiB-like acyl-CoA transferase|nr:CoA transferase [Rhodospirillales bacterium]MBT4007206.1 CoA transferase [Rhodospirillales bacterium]MBT5075973.1 CoA transferase [Rhodospirillales bacterium]MBT5113539.1 CoA transferase [Rhodospirillales bacterium]MBT5673837.1 CoA transferase [Rhodospirillales bacterium]